MLPNCPQYIIAAFAVLRLGAVVVNINPSYTPREVPDRRQPTPTPRIVITLDALAPLVQGGPQSDVHRTRHRHVVGRIFSGRHAAPRASTAHSR